VRELALVVIVALTACTARSDGVANPEVGGEKESFAPLPAPSFEDAIRHVDGRLASRAMSGDVSSSSQIVRELTSATKDNPTRDEFRSQHFWLEIDAQNGSLDSVIELATYSEATTPFYCQRAKYWASVASERFPEYEAELRRRAKDDDPQLVERTIRHRMDAISSSLARACIDP